MATIEGPVKNYWFEGKDCYLEKEDGTVYICINLKIQKVDGLNMKMVCDKVLMKYKDIDGFWRSGEV